MFLFIAIAIVFVALVARCSCFWQHFYIIWSVYCSCRFSCPWRTTNVEEEEKKFVM